MQTHLTVSVIIPHYRDLLNLRQCLKSIDLQSYPKDLIQIIVVNNEATPILKEKLSDLNISVMFLSEPIAGSYIARNKGIEFATGNFIFFTDSDCIVDKDWVSNGVQALLKSPIVGGRIKLILKNKNRPKLLEHFEKIFYFNQNLTIEHESYAATANLLIRKEVLATTGLFDPILRSGGDKEWCQRAHKKGFKTIFCHKTIVFHRPRTLYPFIKRRIRLVSGIMYLRARSEGLNLIDLKEMLKFFTFTSKMKQWNVNWSYYNELPNFKKFLVWSIFRMFCLLDIIIILLCFNSYKLMKKLTLIDRHKNDI